MCKVIFSCVNINYMFVLMLCLHCCVWRGFSNFILFLQCWGMYHLAQLYVTFFNNLCLLSFFFEIGGKSPRECKTKKKTYTPRGEGGGLECATPPSKESRPHNHWPTLDNAHTTITTGLPKTPTMIISSSN